MAKAAVIFYGEESRFSQPVLYCASDAWALSRIPADRCGAVYHAPDHAALSTVLNEVTEDLVLLICAVAPLLSEEDYSELFASYEESGAPARFLDAPRTAVLGADELREALHAGETEILYKAEDGAIVEIEDALTAADGQAQAVARINREFIASGVRIFAPDNTYISPDAVIEPGAQILPGCMIRPGCKIGAGAVIGPNTVLEQAEIGAGTSVNNSQVYESTVGANVTVGPFAYIRPGCAVGDNARIGDFVELKKAQIGSGTKVSHLTYIGDAEVGERVNFGCGTVVVNYDGYVKHKTTIGDDCFIGCNTNLVAPVSLGDRAFTAAGTTVTKDVPDGALAVARTRQTVYEGWNDKRRAAHGEK